MAILPGWPRSGEWVGVAPMTRRDKKFKMNVPPGRIECCLGPMCARGRIARSRTRTSVGTNRWSGVWDGSAIRWWPPTGIDGKVGPMADRATPVLRIRSESSSQSALPAGDRFLDRLWLVEAMPHLVSGMRLCLAVRSQAFGKTLA